MAYTKLNVLHLHLVDFQSFPFQSEARPPGTPHPTQEENHVENPAKWGTQEPQCAFTLSRHSDFNLEAGSKSPSVSPKSPRAARGFLNQPLD